MDTEPTAAPRPGVAFAEPPPTTTPTPPPTTVKPTAPAFTVELTAVTLADDCGGAAPAAAPAAKSKSATKADIDDSAQYKQKQKRRCEQTSMQLAVSASANARIQIKSVELLDEKGASLGTLTASKPTRWSEATATYDAWDEMLAANTPVSVSYVLQQPDWVQIGNRWNRTFTLKTVVTVGGVDRSVNKDVTLTAPTAISQPVKT